MRLSRLLRPADHDTPLVEQAPPVAARAIVRRFWPFARPYRPAIALGLLLLILVPLVEAVGIALFGRVVDDVLVPQDLGALVPIALAYLGLVLLGAALSFGDDYVATWVGERFLIDLRAHLHRHLLALSPGQVARRPVGDLLSRVTSDVAAIERFLLSALGEAISALARLVFFTGAMLLISWRLALVAFVVGPIFYLASRRFASLARHAAREKRRRSGSLAAVAEESLSTVAVVQSLGREDDEARRFADGGRGIMDAELAAVRIAGAYGPVVGLLEMTGALLVLAAGVWALGSGGLTLGALLVFITYLAQAYRPIRSLGQLTSDVLAAAAGAERVIELLDERPTVTDAPDARPLPRPVRGHVELRGVRVRHPGADRDALHGVSLVVRPGETVALTGRSGAGKSTLTSLLLRFVDPDEGAVLLDGHDVREVPLTDLRAHVGLLLQDTVLPDVTAREAIAHGRPGATEQQIEAAARAAGIHEVLTALPDGYDERIGRGGGRLSGGQRRRVAIARTLLRDAPVLVLDEPTTGLDAATRDGLLDPLRTLTSRATTLVVTHDPAVLAWADRVVVLADGRVVDDAGAPAAPASPRPTPPRRAGDGRPSAVDDGAPATTTASPAVVR
ncbi:ABC transporter ATP-binding protein [Patulibacter americanus]|uniref:ABC transporter ATP-binding protein n=1 Tax=Patulibacter americanus TaxID=588672 RepID=UPI0003B530C5|nr:ABC transporter ATP-binding protein [Patulibacter americanus]